MFHVPFKVTYGLISLVVALQPSAATASVDWHGHADFSPRVLIVANGGCSTVSCIER